MNTTLYTNMLIYIYKVQNVSTERKNSQTLMNGSFKFYREQILQLNLIFFIT
jgi:hypothetical protein